MPRGRPRSLEKNLNEYMLANRKHIPKILDSLVASASTSIKAKCPACSTKFDIPGGGSVDAMKYLLDRFYGKPTQTIEAEIKAITISGDKLAAIQAAAQLAEQQRLANRSTDVLVIDKDGLDNDSTASET